MSQVLILKTNYVKESYTFPLKTAVRMIEIIQSSGKCMHIKVDIIIISSGEVIVR